MPYVQWKGTGNQAARHRMRRIRWTRRERIGVVIIGLLVAVVALVSAWLGSNMPN